MTWSPSIRRAPEALPAHLGRLAEQLGELAVEVRSSVAGLAGDAIGRAVRDVLLRFWNKSSPMNSQPSREEEDAYGWPTDDWDRPSHAWEDSVQESSLTVPAPAQASRLSLALQAGGWLLQHGSMLGLLGVSAAVGGVFLFPGAIGIPGVELLNAIAEIAGLIALLSSACKQLVLN